MNQNIMQMLNLEKKKINDKMTHKETLLNSIQENLEKDENDFYHYKEKIRSATKFDEEVFNQKIKSIDEEKEKKENELLKTQKYLEDEAKKIFFNIKKYSQFAYFVHNVFGQKIEDFLTNVSKSSAAKETIDEMIENSDDITYNQIVEAYIDKYSFCLDDDLLHTDKILADESEFMNRYHNFEKGIIHQLQLENELNVDIVKLSDNSKLQNINYQIKLDEFDSEIEKLKNEKSRYEEQIVKIKNSLSSLPNDIVDYIKQIYYNLEENFNPKLSFDKSNLLNCTNTTVRKVVDLEMLVNKEINKLQQLEQKSVNDLFNKVVREVKDSNKKKKLNEARKALVEIAKGQKSRADKRFNKFVIKSRKIDAPFFLQNKKKKQKEFKYTGSIDTNNYDF